MLSIPVRVLHFLLVVFIVNEFQVKSKVTALQCHCGKNDVFANNCKVINGYSTMTCKKGEDVCMNIETLGGNYSLARVDGYLYQGCWRSPANGKASDCSERPMHIKEDLHTKSAWPSWVCYCDTDMCNGNGTVDKNVGGKLIAWSMVEIGLIGALIAIAFNC